MSPWVLNMRRTLVTGTSRAPIEFSLLHQITPDFRIGAEWMPRDQRLSGIWTWRIAEATDTTPAVVLGQGTAWPSSEVSGYAYSLSFAQPISQQLSAYLSFSYLANENIWRVPGGAVWRFSPEWSTKVMWDGRKLHPFITRHFDDWEVSLLMLDGETLTLATSYIF